MTKVFIVDDHVLIREGLKKILRIEPNFTVVGEAQYGYEALDKLDKCHCDMLILDIALPDKSGLEILKEVKARHPKILVLVLSMHPEKRYALRALIDGADGYLTKNSAVEELILALQAIMAGKKYVSRTVAQELVDNLQSGQKRPIHANLSDREFQILLLIGSGKTVSQIAGEINLSVSTVNTHRLHILGKMDLKTNAELMRYVLENHLLD
ncbi:MAG: response regulator transcription factor [Bacteroidota bacterium]